MIEENEVQADGDGEADELLNDEPKKEGMPETNPEIIDQKQKETQVQPMTTKEEASKEDNDDKQVNLEEEKEKYEREDHLDFVRSYLPGKESKKMEAKLKETDFTPEEWEKHGSYNYFFCEKNCNISVNICANCMKLTQRFLGLKPHYLVNCVGRLCTYKHGNIYCNAKLRKEEKLKNGLKYSYLFRCGHSGQCSQCKKLTDNMKDYFSEDLIKRLENREKN